MLGATRHPTGQWVTQQARNVMNGRAEGADGFRFLIRDRDTKFTANFDAVFADAEIVVLRSPPRAPKAGAYAERWVAAIRRECLDRMLIFSQRQLSGVLAEYQTHCNTHRVHRALDQRSATTKVPAPVSGPEIVVRRVEILGCLINEYRSAA